MDSFIRVTVVADSTTGAGMDDATGDAVNSFAGFRDMVTLSARGMDDLARCWDQEATLCDDLGENSRDPLSVLSSMIGAGLSTDTRMGM